MKDQFLRLIEVAKLDNEIAAINEEMGAIPTLIIELEEKLAGLDSQVGQQKSNIENLKISLAQKQSLSLEKKEWANGRDEKVKEIKTNKEYQAALKEVTQTKKDIETLDAECDAIGAKIDEALKTVQQLETDLEAQKAALKTEIAEKQAQISEIKSRLGEKTKVRDEQIKNIAEPVLKRYLTIYTRVKPAMALAESGVCSECNVNLPPQLFIELQKLLQLVSCPRCQRILYLDVAS